MLSDCFSLLVALAAMYVSMSGRRDQMYTFGYARAEVLSGLFNGIFLVFVAFNVFLESIERIYEPQHIQGEGLLLVSVAGLLVNIVGLIFFHEHAHGGQGCGHGHPSHSHAEQDSHAGHKCGGKHDHANHSHAEQDSHADHKCGGKHDHASHSHAEQDSHAGHKCGGKHDHVSHSHAKEIEMT